MRTLAEKQQVGEAEQQRQELDDRSRDLRIAVDDLSAEQKRADRDVEQVRTRRERDQGRIDAGQISDPKALERMTHELESLHRRIATLEDEELEVMARLEDAQLDLRQVTEELAGVDQRLEGLRATRDEKLAVLENDLTAVHSEREAIAGGLPEDLLGLYAKLRESKGGVGAAELRRGECGGCRLSLNAADLRDIAGAPEDDVVRCEECQRILVRTPESGL
ncbi:hypothetical protein D9V37_10700 [Nocardioides mangrovicus]|uniref:Uncharacterized protein n=1 Tax=Nocardioides mangrovicus TaxID=2478913 RepID=A0A3L8P375_9ACTN|nr:C4-type zinc ribbon domain-containing protein [Nocardioides mangrovicus]RLV49039.1 hypothetical protein D9V37_10700 [Nocardioides mangrovicus]